MQMGAITAKKIFFPVKCSLSEMCMLPSFLRIKITLLEDDKGIVPKTAYLLHLKRRKATTVLPYF